MVELESIVQYLSDRFDLPNHPDYSTALNGLQVQGGRTVRKVASAVDTSEQVILAAVEAGADLLLVHHGLFWSGVQPIVGRHHRKISALMDNDLSLWSCHLPLDGDHEFGNAALLARAAGVEPKQPFGDYKTASIGWSGDFLGTRDRFTQQLESALGGSVQLIPGGPTELGRVAFVTGSGASFMEAALSQGIDTLVTGEGSHHTYVDAIELGMNLYYGGHYRTEVFGVTALGEELSRRFDLEFEFLDFPSGL